ncbi:MAG: MliC family protein [Ideonella sp.]|jgi:membrane-bound inhibitor of C-type lysozyme|nr:MliC family protein [Ideonella sp.]
MIRTLPAGALRLAASALAAGSLVALMPLVAQAQAQPAAPAKPAAQAKPAPQGQAQRQGQAQQRQGQPQRQVQRKPAAPVLAAATPEQMQAAERAHFGGYACEFDQTVDVKMNPKTPGYVDVEFKGRTITTKPVLSSTGALRLEDVTGRMVMIQIANKSMLMDTKIGQRVVDNCVHPEQAKFVPQTS